MGTSNNDDIVPGSTAAHKTSLISELQGQDGAMVKGAKDEVRAAKLFDLAEQRIYIPGHSGMVGSALLRRLGKIDCEIITRPRKELDLCDGSAVDCFFAESKPRQRRSEFTIMTGSGLPRIAAEQPA